MTERAHAAGTTEVDAGSVLVRIPGPLRALTDGADEVAVTAGTVSAALDALVVRYPGLRRHLLTDGGGVRDYVNIFLGDSDVRYLDGMATRAEAGATITIVPSIAGG